MLLQAILIEDSAEIRRAVTPVLRELAEVDVVAYAEDAAYALRLLYRQPCDLVILDLFLKEGSGLDVLVRLRADGYTTAVIVLTNHATADTRSRCLSAGAEAVFDKSTELDAFFEHCLELSDAERVYQETMPAPL